MMATDAAALPSVLVIDDEPINRELLSAFLHGSYEVLQASTGEEGLELARQHPPDMVLCDVMMPGIDGFETTRRLKATSGGRYLPIVLVTALGDSTSRRKGFEAGADEFVTKPVDRLELQARLRNLDALRRERQMLAEQNEHLLRLRQFQQQATFLMVHDLKNPLAAVALNMGFAQMQLRKMEGVEESLSALDDARSACARLQRLIAEVLDTSRLEDHQLQLALATVDANALASSAAEDFVRRAQEERLELTVQAASARILVDVDITRRAIQAMLENAFKFTPAGQRVELTVEGQGDSVSFQVSCAAPEIPEAYREQAFAKYVPPADRPAGTVQRGHGLYYVRLVSEAHGGRAELAQHPQFPTAFRMTLPREARPPAR